MSNFFYYQLDVFTDQPFCGNPLAVFPEAEGLSDEQMQKIANEMNLSETVFVLPSEKALRRLRIFTPKQELPVVGTWNLLAGLGATPQIDSGAVKIEQELNLGVLPVEIEFRGGRPFQVVMTQGVWQISEKIAEKREIEKLAKALGLQFADLNNSSELPIAVVSTGIKSMAVPLRSLAALERIKINSSLLSDIYLARGAIGCYAFALETIEKTSRVHARFFAPDDGINEDAATGSAAGALSGYLVHHGTVETHEKIARFTIEQGDFMKRPSRIYAEVTGMKGNVERVKIGGRAVIVAKGEMFLQPGNWRANQ